MEVPNVATIATTPEKVLEYVKSTVRETVAV